MAGLSEQLFADQRHDVNRGKQALKSHESRALGTLESNFNRGQGVYREAATGFDPIIAQRQGATDMYMNSLGLNGQAGYDATVGAFQQGPGYQFALDQANQNVLRNRAATGGVASGGALMELSDRAQQLQNLEFGNWQDRLKGLDVLPAYAMKANALQQLGGSHEKEGLAKSGVFQTFGPQIAGQYNNMAALRGQQALMFEQQQAQEQAQRMQMLGLGAGLLGGVLGA